MCTSRSGSSSLFRHLSWNNVDLPRQRVEGCLRRYQIPLRCGRAGYDFGSRGSMTEHFVTRNAPNGFLPRWFSRWCIGGTKKVKLLCVSEMKLSWIQNFEKIFYIYKKLTINKKSSKTNRTCNQNWVANHHMTVVSTAPTLPGWFYKCVDDFQTSLGSCVGHRRKKTFYTLLWSTKH